MSKSDLSESSRTVLAAILDAGEPVSLAQLHAQEVAGLSHPGLYHNLQQLVNAGLIERIGEHRTKQYRPVERVDVGWTARLGGRWRRMEWSCEPPFDWRFPLVSRVPSADARRELLRFLPRIDDRLLHRPDVAVCRFQDEGWPVLDDVDPAIGHDVYVHLASPSSYGPCIVGVFGSAARGDDRDTSDVDVLVVLPVLQRPHENKEVQRVAQQIADETRTLLAEEFRDLVADLSLKATRPLDLHVHNDPHRRLPKPLLDTIAREGITVQTTGPHDFLERPDAWLLE